jgi:Uma2 family endonuclease
MEAFQDRIGGSSMTSPSVAESSLVLGPELAGILMSPDEFDAVEDYDADYRYELIHGVLVVTPIPLSAEVGPNEWLGHLLLTYRDVHPQGRALDATLPERYVRTADSRRRADRVIWAGLGRMPEERRDVPTIVVEFVSEGRRNRQRDYVDKRREYAALGIGEYWVFDRFQRRLTVFGGQTVTETGRIVEEHEIYETPHLPGFELPLARLLAVADAWK